MQVFGSHCNRLLGLRKSCGKCGISIKIGVCEWVSKWVHSGVLIDTRALQKSKSDLTDRGAAHRNTKSWRRGILLLKSVRGQISWPLRPSREAHALTSCCDSDSSVHAPFAFELGCSGQLVFWPYVAFRSSISGSFICSPFTAASAKQQKNEPRLFSVKTCNWTGGGEDKFCEPFWN